MLTLPKIRVLTEFEALLGFYSRPAGPKSFPMASKSLFVTKHRLTSRASSEYAPVFYMSYNTYTRLHIEDGISTLNDVARTSTSFTTYMLRVNFYALRLRYI